MAIDLNRGDVVIGKLKYNPFSKKNGTPSLLIRKGAAQ